MLDLNRIRENPQEVRCALLKRAADVDFSELLGWDRERRSLITRSDELKARRNAVSAQIPAMKMRGEDAGALLEEMKSVSAEIKSLDLRRVELDGRIRGFLEVLPNVPDEDVPAGGKDNNQVVRTSGSARDFAFDARDHVDLVTTLGLVDFERGVKMGGNGFWLYRGFGARLEWALINYFIGVHLRDGYEFMLPPHILNYACGYTAGQFPKFADDVFAVDRAADGALQQFLLPTAETALVNLYRDEVLPQERLPLKFFAYTPCYRREAGSYRTGERGTIRGHQFNKVEMFQFTAPEDSDAAMDELIGKAEELVRGLELHYRVVKLSAGDSSASMARTFDVEVWFPSMGEFKEVSSISNARDYQARRGNIRFKRKDTGKNDLVHTLNGSGLATSRLIPAICEQHQQADGSVRLPKVLQASLGTDVLRAAGA